MMPIPEGQKKVYLVITMAILGCVLLGSLYAFRSKDTSSDATGSKGGIVSQKTDFNITLDTLDTDSRKAFYRKERQRDTMILANPFATKSEAGTGSQILEATSLLEADSPRTKPRNNFSEDLWDLEGEEQQDNLGLVSQADKNANYRAELLKARTSRLERSQDYSAPKTTEKTSQTAPVLEFTASIYRDQFILPGDRVQLILNNPITYNGNLFEKNTFIYATATIQGSRVQLKVTNIDHIPVLLSARDITDGNQGMYSERAGELWQEFTTETQSQGVNNAATEITSVSSSQMLNTALSSFGSFFRKKKYRQRDKVLLVNNDRLILTTR